MAVLLGWYSRSMGQHSIVRFTASSLSKASRTMIYACVVTTIKIVAERESPTCNFIIRV